MHGMAIIISPAGEFTEHHLTEPPSVPRLQEWVGGYIERVPLFTSYTQEDRTFECVTYCDEEGKLKGKHRNPEATALWMIAALPHSITPDFLVGDVVILFGDDAFLEAL